MATNKQKLEKAVTKAANTPGISPRELKFIKDLGKEAKKGGVTANELKAIEKEINTQKKDKNTYVGKAKQASPKKYLAQLQDSSTVATATVMPPPPPPVDTITPDPVRIANRNVTNISDLVPQFSPEHIAKILFENVSAIELSIVERHDTIEGINQRYSIISNLSEIRKKYDAAKQLSTMDKSKPLTSIYAINIQDKIPQEDYIVLENLDSTYQYLDENDNLIIREKGYYYIDTNGDLVIELINLERSQEVEVYIDTNGTIYKVES